MIPDANNVYGYVDAPQGLNSILRSIEQLVGSNRVSIYRSSFDGTETLRFSTNTTEFESTPLEHSDRHLLNGAVDGEPPDVVAFVRAMSELLANAGIEHRFEVYEIDRKLFAIVPE